MSVQHARFENPFAHRCNRLNTCKFIRDSQKVKTTSAEQAAGIVFAGNDTLPPLGFQSQKQDHKPPHSGSESGGENYSMEMSSTVLNLEGLEEQRGDNPILVNVKKSYGRWNDRGVRETGF